MLKEILFTCTTYVLQIAMKKNKQETVITGNNSSQRFFFSWARVLHHKISTPVPASHVIIFAGPAHVVLATDLR